MKIEFNLFLNKKITCYFENEKLEIFLSNRALLKQQNIFS
jgi:hypothetical protein